MPKCIFCGEWAGADSNQHEECAEEFRRYVIRAGPVERIVLRALAKIRALRSALAGPFARFR